MDKIKALRSKFDSMQKRRTNAPEPVPISVHTHQVHTTTKDQNCGISARSKDTEPKVRVVPIKLEVPKPDCVETKHDGERRGSKTSLGDRKSSISDEKLQELEEAFHLFDMNRDGMITKEELGAVLYALGQRPTVTEVQDMIRSVDIDRNGKIDFEEFVKIFSMKISIDPEEELHDVFCIFDQNSDGFITADELYEMLKKLGETITINEAQKMIKEADLNRDGKVDYKEFKAILNAR